MLQEIADASLDLATAIHDGEYKAVIVAGGSNQLSRSLLATAWMAQYPEEQLLPVFVFDVQANKMLYKATADLPERKAWTQKWIDENLPHLNELKNEKLCFVDDFGGTGIKVNETEKTFRELGFTNIDFRIFATSETAEFEHEVSAARRNDELVLALQEMSENIKGMPSLDEIMNNIELTGEERRLRTLDQLREVGRRARH